MDTSIASYLLDIHSPNLYFYRNSNHNEIDIVMQHHDKIIPIEVKSTATLNGSLMKNIEEFHS